eukprot:8362092-Pyramimonas_sp.AAC.1
MAASSQPSASCLSRFCALCHSPSYFCRGMRSGLSCSDSYDIAAWLLPWRRFAWPPFASMKHIASSPPGTRPGPGNLGCPRRSAVCPPVAGSVVALLENHRYFCLTISGRCP